MTDRIKDSLEQLIDTIYYVGGALRRTSASMSLHTDITGEATPMPSEIVRLAESIENHWKIMQENHMILTGERMRHVLACEQVINRLGFTVHDNVNHYVEMLKGGEYGKDVADRIYDDIVKKENAEKSNK